MKFSGSPEMGERLPENGRLHCKRLRLLAAISAVAARGGTDGAQLTFRGLPCPNIATGGYNAHSVREFIPVPSLKVTVDLLEKLVAKFATRG